MPFLSLSFVNFRNIQDTVINTAYPEIFLVGENGQGKTNFLEALYISSYGSSFRTNSDSQICNEGKKEYSILSLYKESETITNNVSIIYRNNKKEIQKNIKKIKRKDLINTIPCILFYGSDIEFAVGSQERKRFFFDQCLAMYNKNYLNMLQTYSTYLKSKNIALKQNNKKLLDTYDLRIVPLAIEITKYREDLIHKFNSLFSEFYEKVSGLKNIKISYRPIVKTQSEKELLSLLSDKRDDDIKNGSSLIGPHRDRIHFLRDEKPFEKKSSNGQNRLISLVLRALQAHFYTKLIGKKPVFLMDDVLLELDPEKRTKFTSLLPEYDQLFCTFLPGEAFQNYKKKNTKILFVKGGKFEDRS